MTNSPPAKVNLSPDEPARVLASGIDSLSLALDVRWADGTMFERLANLKARAKSAGEDEPSELVVGDDSAPWRFNVKPHGVRGYEWVLVGKEMGLRIGQGLEPKSRPSIMADLRSETLWMHGPDIAIERVVALIVAMGGEVLNIKPSRVDLCCDVLLRESDWSMGLMDSFVTRARDINPYFQHRILTGFTIGRGNVSARLYDKLREIMVKSGKVWMFDIWGMPSAGDGQRIIRVEYQLRREALREFKIDLWSDLRDRILQAWAYCTRQWLHLADDASKHHTQQHPLPWWSVVQAGFAGAQNATPLVRHRATIQNERQLSQQLLGIAGSIASLRLPASQLPEGKRLNMQAIILGATRIALAEGGIDDSEFTDRIRRKQAKNRRCGPGFTEI